MPDAQGEAVVIAFPTPVQPLNETATPVMTLDEALDWAWDQGYIG